MDMSLDFSYKKRKKTLLYRKFHNHSSLSPHKKCTRSEWKMRNLNIMNEIISSELFNVPRLAVTHGDQERSSQLKWLRGWRTACCHGMPQLLIKSPLTAGAVL